MINIGAFLQVKDNSGAKRVQCIKVFNKSKRKAISLANFLLICIKRSINKKNSKIKKTKIQHAILIGAKKKNVRINGSQIKTKKNSVVLLNSNKVLLGSRLLGFMPQEVRLKGVQKVVTTAKFLI